MDEMDAELPVLKEFVLPGGGEQVSRSHICRCVCRRLERCVVRWLEECEQEGECIELRFVNRLSDYFFVLARFLAKNLEISLIVWEK
jgi:cob(I)alamin adenosyltransferase